MKHMYLEGTTHLLRCPQGQSENLCLQIPTELLQDFTALCLLKMNSGYSVLISKTKETHMCVGGLDPKWIFYVYTNTTEHRPPKWIFVHI